MEMVKIRVKKILFYILLIIVTLLVLTAFYFNRYKFSSINIIRYEKVNLEEETSITEIAGKYSDNKSKEKFVSEIKRINNISSPGYIPGNSTIIIPIIETE